MKKLISAIIVLVLFCAAVFDVGMYAETSDVVRLPHTDSVKDKTEDDRRFYGFLGRLRIPDADIDVALYDSSEQSVCNRWDSACVFTIYPYIGKVIADHCNQEFSTLKKVTVGTLGEITLADGTVRPIRCVEMFDGHNNGAAITDGNWKVVLGKYDYLTYTCVNGWQNVRVCQWEIIKQKPTPNLRIVLSVIGR